MSRLVTPAEYRGAAALMRFWRTTDHVCALIAATGEPSLRVRDTPELNIVIGAWPIDEMDWLGTLHSLAEALDIAAELAEQRP